MEQRMTNSVKEEETRELVVEGRLGVHRRIYRQIEQQVQRQGGLCVQDPVTEWWCGQEVRRGGAGNAAGKACWGQNWKVVLFLEGTRTHVMFKRRPTT